MPNQSTNKEDVRELSKRARGILVHSIKKRIVKEDILNKKWISRFYVQWTNLAYIVALGGSKAKLKRDMGLIEKQEVREHITVPELFKLANLEIKIATLIDSGAGYQTVKGELLGSTKK